MVLFIASPANSYKCHPSKDVYFSAVRQPVKHAHTGLSLESCRPSSLVLATARSGERTVAVLALAMALLLAAPRVARGALSCSDVYQDLMPCLSYIGGSGNLDPSCCDGINSLIAAARSTADRQAACGCLENVTSGVSGPYVARAAALPGLCHVSIPYKISPSTDCAKIK